MGVGVLQACSTCRTTSLVNVRPAAASQDFELQSSQPYVTRLLVPDLLDARLGLCEPVSERFICLQLRIAPGRQAVLSQPTFRLSRSGLPREVLRFPEQQYQVLCESRGAASLKCPLPIEIASQPDAPKQLLHAGSHQDWRFERWAYTVEPMLTFQGLPGDPDPPAWQLFSKYSTWRNYRLQLVPASRLDEGDTRLELPDIEIGGKR
ncbi:hypothetical protein [Roseateles saccharophilus]|uniref:Uncharacterized protein n=1 Tax=Roseateles saccharophilus TaxID=304 RepID=A0A4V2VT09_ROSSA|nr:hypothetical protein [Roseateles saccharophilus]MDG0831370.1 hypothetical protein [Roseateles saccharophilus]TCV04500.1 hypothetical protein EV671_1001256 [Roseateles saccharophilus]